MEYAIELKNIEEDLDLKKIETIYYGDPFCQNLIPDVKELEFAYNFIKGKGKNFVLNTPFVTDNFMDKILKNIEYISKEEEKFSIVFNDWGIFYEIKKRFPGIKLILGRLLTKQRTDPNVEDIITNSQAEYIDGIRAKKVPESLFKIFQQSVVNDEIFQKYLMNNGIRRVEIEFLIWDMILDLPEEIKVSIYYPYAHIATTRLCGLLNMTYDKCTKICQNTKINYKTQEKYSYVHIGNTTYYNVENIVTKEKIKKYKNIDRIVFNDVETYSKVCNNILWQ